MKSLSAFVSIIFFGLISATANASPIHYIESVDGPLSASNPLVMGVGTNVIEGSDCWHSDPFCLSVSDFVFTIQSGTELVNYRYIFGDLVLATTSPASWTGNTMLRGIDNTSLMIHTNIANWLTGTTQTLSATNLNWSEGDYRQFLVGSRSGDGGTWDFRIELDVISTITAIPLPATLLFFAFGLGMAGLMRRRSCGA